jgi:hypothetical protein
MKYYLYISDAKIDMLYPQVPHPSKNKIATKFGFDLKFLSASRSSETEQEENRITRLEAVVQFIRESGRIGSVDKPGDYFEGTLSMHTTTLPDRDPLFVYFAGETKKATVGLWGSLRHVFGQSGTPIGAVASSSMARDALWHIIQGLDHDFQPASPAEGFRLKLLEDNAQRWIAGSVNSFGIPPEQWWSVIRVANFEAGFLPGQNVEFVAKRLMEHKEPGHRVILGTPLYVALADAPL